jgi:cytochrome c biogenesis protein CcmG/thiol:disulfide interchange protein DsbE
MNKILPFLVLVFLIGGIAIATHNLQSQQEISSPEDEREDEREDEQEDGVHFVKSEIALPEFSLINLYDEKDVFSKKDLIGKYSLVSFFASWCSTCKAQHDILLRLKNENIIDIYGVAWRDIDANTLSYLDGHGNPYTKTASDSRGLFTKITGLRAVPETWIVDKTGVVVMRFRGNLQEFSIDEIKNFLNQNK